jgi:polar amino acid transport system ATP-binding protein
MIETLEFCDVRKRYGQVEAVASSTLALRAGETVVLLGPSGSGKSTLLRMLALLEDPDGGEINLNSRRLFPRSGPAPEQAALERSFRLQSGYVFQDFALWPHCTALENITKSLMLVHRLSSKEATARGRALLQQLGIQHLEKRLPSRLSGGERQRVAIARALAASPDFIFLDEITSALDPEHVKGVLQVVKDLALQGGKAVVIVTHHIGFARAVATRVIFLFAGRVLEEGSPMELLTQPRTPELRRFLDAVLPLNGGGGPSGFMEQ